MNLWYIVMYTVRRTYNLRLLNWLNTNPTTLKIISDHPLYFIHCTYVTFIPYLAGGLI